MQIPVDKGVVVVALKEYDSLHEKQRQLENRLKKGTGEVFDLEEFNI